MRLRAWWWETDTLGVAVGGLDEAKVDQPGTTIELRVGGFNHPFAVLVDSLKNDDAGDLFGLLTAQPPQGDGLAVMPHVQLLEGNGGLRALAGLESDQGRESSGS